MGLTSGYVQVSDAGSDEPSTRSGGPRLKAPRHEIAIIGEPGKVYCGLFSIRRVTAESDLARHGVCPGSSLKTLGHEETGLRI
jgi:hypothetical protein